MPFTVFVKLPKSHQLPEFWGQSYTQSMWILRAQHIIFLRSISILLPFTFPLCDWTPPISAARGAGWAVTQLQAQELRVSLYWCSAIWALCGGENSWSGKQLEGGKDRWRKSDTRAQEGRRWQLWSGLAQETWWRELSRTGYRYKGTEQSFYL